MISAACRPPSKPATHPDCADAGNGRPIALHLPFESYRFEEDSLLLRRLLDNPYGYFRFTNLRFSDQICRRIDDVLAAMPTVNLHGDAHLEQYAVTSVGRGLADYDDASSGPAVIDLVRFGVSIRIAAGLREWESGPTIDEFFRGYREALEDPEVEAATPAYVRRIEMEFSDDRNRFLDEVESLMKPLVSEDERQLIAGYQRYVALLRETYAALPEYFFTLKKYGRLTTGFGSAMDKKFLIRIEGTTLAATDDVILEAKEIRDISSISCINASGSGGAFRILLGKTRIGRQPIRFLAEVPRAAGESSANPPLWIQEWLHNYRELNIMKTLRSVDELSELAHDIGVQLGRGHVAKIASPLDAQLRRAQIRMLVDFEPRIRKLIDEMTGVTYKSWEMFRREAASHKAARRRR
ncbi:MAG: DUF2252 domain-containing protein [Proteobacteria bacterium]|nr:DUF2252 domain-containing protein [Pseudomonadota bacterium]